MLNEREKKSEVITTISLIWHLWNTWYSRLEEDKSLQTLQPTVAAEGERSGSHCAFSYDIKWNLSLESSEMCDTR